MEQQIIFKIGPDVPVMSYAKFAEKVGRSQQWVKKQVSAGNIPVITQDNQDPLINLALYWQKALAQAY